MRSDNVTWIGISGAFFWIIACMIAGCGEITTTADDAGTDSKPLTANGYQCVNHVDCASGYCPNSICANKLANDTHCGVNLECASNFCRPDTNICIDKPRILIIGEPCEQLWQCESTYCNSQHVCDSPKPPGSPCNDNSGCTSGHCGWAANPPVCT